MADEQVKETRTVYVDVFDTTNIKEGDIVVDDQSIYFAALKDRGVQVYNPFEEWIPATVK